MAELNFKKGLYKISSHFSRSEVDKLKFIFSDSIPRRQLERATSAFHVFCLLERHDLLSRTNLSFFREILSEVHKAHYIDKYVTNYHPSDLSLTQERGLQDATFLANLSDELTRENVRDIGLFFSGETIPVEDIESISDGVTLFGKLKDAGVDFAQLKEVMSVLSRKDLVRKMESFLESCAQSQLGQDMKSPEADTVYKQLSRGFQEEGNDSMDSESYAAGSTSLTSLGGSVMVTTPTRLIGSSMGTASLDGGKGACLLLPTGKVKDMPTKQLSLVVDEEDKKITELKRVVVAVEEEKSHTSDAARVRELETLLNEKVKEVQSQMEETKALRDALMSRTDAPIYQMTSRPHGLAVIFVNGKFDRNVNDPKLLLKNRAGAEKDEELFQSTFKFLGYSPVVYRNLSGAEMFGKMAELNNVDHSEYDSLVVCVSSHGNQRSIYGSDSVEVNRDEFCNSVKSCPSLATKPKLFFIQACRLPVVSADSPQGDQGVTSSVATPLHPDADMLIANASTTHSAAYISPHYGSWFATSLHRKLTDSKLVYSRVLLQILQEVNLEVCEQLGITTDNQEPATQCVEVTTRLRMGVRFFQSE